MKGHPTPLFVKGTVRMKDIHLFVQPYKKVYDLAWRERLLHLLNPTSPSSTMSFYKSKRSNPVAAEGKENTPLIDHSSSPPSMTKEDDAYVPSQPPLTQAPLPCEPDMEGEDNGYESDFDTSSPAEDDLYDLPSSYADDIPQDSPSHSPSRSRSPTPTLSTPRARSFDEDTEMPLSSPIRTTWSSSQESTSSSSSMSSQPQGDGNPTSSSMAYLAKGHDFTAEVDGEDVQRNGDAPLTRSSQESIRTDYSHERLSSPSLEESTSSQPSRDFSSSLSYQESSSQEETLSSSSHNDQEDTTPRSFPQPSSSSSSADTDMNSSNTPMMSEAGSRSPASSEEERRREMREWFGSTMHEERLEENMRLEEDEDGYPSSDQEVFFYPFLIFFVQVSS